MFEIDKYLIAVFENDDDDDDDDDDVRSQDITMVLSQKFNHAKFWQSGLWDQNAFLIPTSFALTINIP